MFGLQFQLGRLKQTEKQLNSLFFSPDKHSPLSHFDAFYLLILIYAQRNNTNVFHNLKSLLKKEHDMSPKIETTFEFNFFMGSCCFYTKEYEQAIHFFQESLNLALEEKNRSHLCHISFCLAQTYTALNQHEKALEELK